jgi:hypothetical protein
VWPLFPRPTFEKKSVVARFWIHFNCKEAPDQFLFLYIVFFFFLMSFGVILFLFIYLIKLQHELVSLDQEIR